MSEQNRLLPDKPEHDIADSRDTEQEVAEKNAQQPDDPQGNLIPADHSLLPGKSRPRISWSYIIRGKHARRNAIAALILLASLGLYLLYTVLPATTATITIMPLDRSLDQSYVFTIAAQPNLASHQVSGRKLTYTTSTKTQTVPVHFTGHLNATSAQGKIVFSQLTTELHIFSKELHIFSNSSFTIHLNNGLLLFVDNISSMPIQYLLPGETYTLPAYVEAGAHGDLPAHAIDDYYTTADRSSLFEYKPPKKPYVVSIDAYLSNPDPFTGGRDAYDGPIVSAVDTRPIENDLTFQLQQEALQVFQSQLHPGEALLNNLQCLPAIQEQPPINSPATSVTITASLNCTIETYDATTTHAQILNEMKQLASQSLDSHVTLREPLQFTLTTSRIPDEPTTFVLRARGQWRLLLDQHGKLAVQQALTGLSQDNARTTLQNRFAARTLALELAWWWGKRLPLDPLAIQIVARYPPSS